MALNSCGHGDGQGNLTEAQLHDGVGLHVRCGEFSFAKLPESFSHILGVTGTPTIAISASPTACPSRGYGRAGTLK